MATGAVSAVATLAAPRHGAFTRTEAASLGLSARNIATAKAQGWLFEPLPGVLVLAGSAPSWRRRLLVGVLAGKDRSRASHRAASVLHGLDGFDDPDRWGRRDVKRAPNVKVLGAAATGRRPEISVLQPAWYELGDFVDGILHQTAALDPCDVVSIDGVPCTGLARTLADLGAVCPDDLLWRALISARRRYRVNPRWISQTALRLERPGRTGGQAIRRALIRWAEEAVLPESWLEELMVRLAEGAGMPALVRQHVVTDERGSFVGRLDAAMPEIKLGFEGHSRQFHFGPICEAADEDRDLRLATVGYEVLYLGWYATQRPTEVAHRIRLVVNERRRLFSVAA
jgi:hypothetical protein